jgi:lysyl-tRNA synthetase class 2
MHNERITTKINADRLKSYNLLVDADKYIDEQKRNNRSWKNSTGARIKTIRNFGSLTFITVVQQYNIVQYAAERSSTADYGLLSLLNPGDIIELVISGSILNKKENTIELVKNWNLISKCFFEPPNKHKGIVDPRLYYGQRYVPMMFDSEEITVFRRIAASNRAVRRVLESKDFEGVQTPVLHSEYGGALARPFTTKLNDSDKEIYLSIAPQLTLKKYIVAGFERVYSIAHCFRNESIGTRHHPEFYMVEAYATYWNLLDVARLSEEIIRAVLVEWGHHITTKLSFKGATIDLNTNAEFRILDYVDSIDEFCLSFAGLNYRTSTIDQIREYLPKDNVVQNASKSDALSVHLFQNYVEHHLLHPIHIINHPLCTTPLCSENASNTLQRIETYLLGVEVANMYSERTDFLKLENAFNTMSQETNKVNQVHVYNKSFLTAMAYGTPMMSGLGVGLTRLYAMAGGFGSIKDVIFEPLSSN